MIALFLKEFSNTMSINYQIDFQKMILSLILERISASLFMLLASMVPGILVVSSKVCKNGVCIQADPYPDPRGGITQGGSGNVHELMGGYHCKLGRSRCVELLFLYVPLWHLQ
jgi:hypothetical protein